MVNFVFYKIMYGPFIIIIIIVIIIYSGTFYTKNVEEPPSKKTKKRKSQGKVPIDQASPSSEDCIGPSPSKSLYTPKLTTLSSWSSAASPVPRRSPRHLGTPKPDALGQGK